MTFCRKHKKEPLVMSRAFRHYCRRCARERFQKIEVVKKAKGWL